MANCKDCIHENVCEHRANIQTDTYAYMGVKYDTEKCEHYMPADVASEVEQLIYKLECLLCHATGGLLSKHTYDLRTIESAVTDYVEKCCDEARAEAKDEVAQEIFEEIEGIIIKYYNYLTNNDELKLLDPIKQAQGFLLNMILKDIDELNEKYTEEQKDG